jgi:hypothetical protein
MLITRCAAAAFAKGVERAASLVDGGHPQRDCRMFEAARCTSCLRGEDRKCRRFPANECLMAETSQSRLAIQINIYPDSVGVGVIFFEVYLLYQSIAFWVLIIKFLFFVSVA